MFASKGTSTGRFTPSRKIRPLIHDTLSPTKSLSIGQICIIIKKRFGVYIPPDTLMIVLLNDSMVIKDYTDELRFKKRVAAKTLPEYFKTSENYVNAFMINAD